MARPYTGTLSQSLAQSRNAAPAWEELMRKFHEHPDIEVIEDMVTPKTKAGAEFAKQAMKDWMDSHG